MNSENASYNCRRRVTNHEVIQFAREIESDPYIPSAKDLMYQVYKSIGMDIDYDSIFED